MDDGELEFSNQDVFSESNLCEWPSSIDSSFNLDDLLADCHACTHTHTCNPPGPDNTHTHTCYHVHTKLVPLVPEGTKANNVVNNSDDTAESSEKNSKKPNLGNRLAVRKYREKKKAKTASLEEEVARLRAINQQLLKRLQGQAALEAEVARLKCLLVDIRGRIEGEIGSFPYQKPINPNMGNMGLGLSSAYMMAPCNVACGDPMYCPQAMVEGRAGNGTEVNGTSFGDCHLVNLPNREHVDSEFKALPALGGGDGTFANSSDLSKMRGGYCTATAS